MHIDYLIKMANDIGDFFKADPDREAAAANIHQHLKRFWDPRMKQQIIAHYNDTNGVGLEGPVLAAVKRLAAEAGKKAILVRHPRIGGDPSGSRSQDEDGSPPTRG